MLIDKVNCWSKKISTESR